MQIAAVIGTSGGRRSRPGTSETVIPFVCWPIGAGITDGSCTRCLPDGVGLSVGTAAGQGKTAGAAADADAETVGGLRGRPSDRRSVGVPRSRAVHQEAAASMTSTAVTTLLLGYPTWVRSPRALAP